MTTNGQTARVQVRFEIDMGGDMFPGCKTMMASVHQALCKAIHERDKAALNWLQDQILDIS